MSKDEKIREIVKKSCDALDGNVPTNDWHMSVYCGIWDAARRDARLELIQWLDTDCDNEEHENYGYPRLMCADCNQELWKERAELTAELGVVTHE